MSVFCALNVSYYTDVDDLFTVSSELLLTNGKGLVWL